MPQRINRTEVRRVGFLLIDGFPLIALGAALDPLRSANDVAKDRLYDWPLISIDGLPVRASSTIDLQVDGAIGRDWILEDLFVVAGATAHQFDHGSTFRWLRELNRRGCRVGSISGGIYLLARAGLLEDLSFSVHWELRSAFMEEFPTLRARPDIFVIDGNRLTCAGGTSALDLMLWVIADDLGWDHALKVGEQLVYPHIRQGWDRQHPSPLERYGIHHGKLSLIIELMEQNVDAPLASGEIARRANISQRQIERLFKQYLKCTPSDFYMRLRLDHARHLLIYTPMPIIEAAIAAGFGSHSYFTKAYRQHFGITPTEEREARRLYPKDPTEAPTNPA